MGKGDIEHYRKIEPEDLEKLHALNPTRTTGLLEYIWFNVQPTHPLRTIINILANIT